MSNLTLYPLGYNVRNMTLHEHGPLGSRNPIKAIFNNISPSEAALREELDYEDRTSCHIIFDRRTFINNNMKDNVKYLLELPTAAIFKNKPEFSCVLTFGNGWSYIISAEHEKGAYKILIEHLFVDSTFSDNDTYARLGFKKFLKNNNWGIFHFEIVIDDKYDVIDSIYYSNS